MAFDLASAKPFDLESATEVKSSGFDLSSAKEADLTSIWEDFKIAGTGALSNVARWTGGLEAAINSAIGNTERADAVLAATERDIKEMAKQANPKGKTQRTRDKAIGLGLTLPLQLATFPFGTATTGQTMIDEGETLNKALLGTVIDTLGNMAGVALPGAIGGRAITKAVTGAGINAAQDVATRGAISAIADQAGTKEKLGPSQESAILSAMLGAAMGPLSPSTNRPDSSPRIDADALLAETKAKKSFDLASAKEVNDLGTQIARDRYNNDAQVAMLEAALAKRNESLPTITVDQNKRAMLPDELEVQRTFERGAAAEEAIAARQAQLEFDVKRQTALDQGAALRARQEAAPTGYESWAEQMRQDISGQPGTNEPINWPRKVADRFPQTETSPMGEGFKYEGALDPGLNDARSLPIEIADALRTGDRPVDPFNRYSPQQAANRILREGEHPPIKKGGIRRGRGPSRGGIDPDLLTFGLSKLVEKFQTASNREFIDDLMGNKLYQEETTGEQVVAAALSEGKDSGSGNLVSQPSTYLGAGGTLEAAKRNSALVLGASRIVQRAKTVAEDLIRSNIFNVEDALRKVKKNDLPNLSEFMKAEQLARTRLGVEDFLTRGGSPDAAIAYNKLRELNDKTGQYLNDILVSQGKDPIKIEPAYMASVWQGDFRRGFYFEEVNPDTGAITRKNVAMLGGNTKLSIEAQTKALLEKFPELKKAKQDNAILKHTKGNLDTVKVFKELVELIGDNDPLVKSIQDWAAGRAELEARGMFGEEKHFDPKANVRGFVGDRPANTLTGKLSPIKESTAYMQAQIDVAKTAYKWGEMQKAAAEMKKIFNDKDLALQQPENMRWVKNYWLDNIGMNESSIAREFDNLIREAGFTPSQVAQGVNFVKSLWITQKLLSAGHYVSNGLQAAMMLPHLSDIQFKHGGNMALAVPYGVVAGMSVAATHMFGAASKTGDAYRYAKTLGVDDFTLRAMKYAEDNSVTTRSIYDEAPIEHSYTASGKAMRVATKIIAAPETMLRSIVFMTYAKMYESTGKYSEMDAFRLAEERVNISMGDYREGERAMVFGKMGTAGVAANTLSTFPMNYFNQWSWATREMGRKNPVPFIAMFATQYAIAGAMGIPGFEDIDKLWETMKDGLRESNPEMWMKVRNIDLKAFISKTMGNAGLYGAASVLTDTALSTRAAAPVGSEMVQTPVAPFVDLFEQGMSVGKAALDPTNPQKAAQALYNVAPVGAQGPLETGLLKDFTSVPAERDGVAGRIYGKPKDMASREGQVFRTPDQEKTRAWGLRDLGEQVERDFKYRAEKRIKQDVPTVSNELVKRMYNSIRNGNKDKAKELHKLYVELNGREVTDQMLETRLMKEFTSSMERTGMNLTTVDGMVTYKKLKEFVEAN